MVPHVAARKMHSGSKNFRSSHQKDLCNNICHNRTHAVQRHSIASLAWVSKASSLLEVLGDALLLSEERVDGRGAAIRMEGLPSRIVALYHGVLTHTAGQ